NNIAKAHGGFSVFTGVGERTREGNDLYHEMQETQVINLDGESKVALVFGQMNEPPGARARVALTGYIIFFCIMSELLFLTTRLPTMDLDREELDSPVQINLEDLTYGQVSCDVPEWYRNPDFGILFKDRPTFDHIAELAPITLAPGLEDVLSSDQPPSTDFFTTLSRPAEGLMWGVYALLMFKPNHAFKLYIGSGTNAEGGVLVRLPNYFASSSQLPRFVKKAFADGYEAQHIGLLFWTPLPSSGLVPKVRGRILAMEALMTFIFHAGISNITDSYISDFLLWPREAVDWEPLCSHSPLKEAIRGGLELSEQELELAAQIRKARSKERSIENNQRLRSRKREADEELYKQNVTKAKLAWGVKNPSKVLKIAEKVRVKAKESRSFFCADCDMPLASAKALDKHLKSTAHRNQVAGIKKAPSKRSVATVAAKRIQTINQKTFCCSACDKTFPNEWSLTRHEATNLHKKRLKNKPDSP
ncbi:MAG: hypothetical protein Q9226_009224, partial [Calogaya cf. arnoldii]